MGVMMQIKKLEHTWLVVDNSGYAHAEITKGYNDRYKKIMYNITYTDYNVSSYCSTLKLCLLHSYNILTK